MEVVFRAGRDCADRDDVVIVVYYINAQLFLFHVWMVEGPKNNTTGLPRTVKKELWRMPDVSRRAVVRWTIIVVEWLQQE